MLLFHVVNGMVGGMVRCGLRMAGCTGDYGILSVGQLLFAFPLMMHYGITGALLACAVIFLYDGTRGFIHGNVAKYGFYAFYPAHLILIYLFRL